MSADCRLGRSLAAVSTWRETTSVVGAASPETSSSTSVPDAAGADPSTEFDRSEMTGMPFAAFAVTVKEPPKACWVTTPPAVTPIASL